MKFAFDLDDTINAAPAQFAAICNALMDAGHEVHVVTYRCPIQHKEYTINELAGYGLRYTDLHMTGEKEELCRMYRMDMALDDCAAWHYPNCWRFTIGFVLFDKGPSSYMVKRSKLSKRRNSADTDDALDWEKDRHDYEDGYNQGYKDAGGKKNECD